MGRITVGGLYPTVGYVGEEIGSDGRAGEQGIFVSQLARHELAPIGLAAERTAPPRMHARVNWGK